MLSHDNGIVSGRNGMLSRNNTIVEGGDRIVIRGYSFLGESLAIGR
jgi:hypothetical protein